MKRNDIKKVVFYCRKGVVAQGDFSYYYQIASYIADNYSDYQVYCAYMANEDFIKEHNNSRVIFCDIEECNNKEFENAIFITAMNQIFFLLNDINNVKKAKVLFLFLNPMTMVWLKNQIAKEPFNLNGMLKLISRNDAYGFGDEAIYLSTQRNSKIKFKQTYFPVVAEASILQNNYLQKDVVDNELINIAWLGRLDRDKVYSVINLLDNIYDSAKSKVIFHIIGDGNARNMINVNKYSPKISLVFNSFMYGEKRDRYLVNNVDLVFAVGTSSLVSASLGVPVVLPIVSDKQFREDKYIYLYETQNYCIGWTLEDIKANGLCTHSMKTILDDIYVKNLKKEIGNKCLEYSNMTFSIKSCNEQIISVFDGTKLTLDKLRMNISYIWHDSFFKAYKLLLNKKATYDDFVVFHKRYAQFMNLPIYERFIRFNRKAFSFVKKLIVDKKEGK